MRSDEEREALIGRMRKAARRGVSMLQFAEAEGLTRSAVAGLKHRHGIVFHGDLDRTQFRERCRQAALRRWERERQSIAGPRA